MALKDIKQALEKIKNIELSHIEHDVDEDYNGDWVYDDYEVFDGTVAENYEEEIKLLEQAIEALELIGSFIAEIDRFPPISKLGETQPKFAICFGGMEGEFDITEDEYNLLGKIYPKLTYFLEFLEGKIIKKQ